MTIPDQHVLPRNDLREHVDRRDCWCKPRIEIVESFLSDEKSVIVVHNSADGRELVERHGVQ